MRRFKRAFAIPYAIVMLLIVTLLCSVILASATSTTKSADKYRTYLDSKNYLDLIGSAAIEKYTNGTDGAEETDYYAEFLENEYGFNITDDDNGKVEVTRGSTVMLYIEFTATDENGERVYGLSSYVYSPGTKAADEPAETATSSETPDETQTATETATPDETAEAA